MNIDQTIDRVEDVGKLATLLATLLGPAGPIGLVLTTITGIIKRVRDPKDPTTPEQGLDELAAALETLGTSLERLKASNATYFDLPAPEEDDAP